MERRVWIDVEDLFEYRRHAARPSGIQRVEYEICRALTLRDDTRGRVRFVRHDRRQATFVSVPWQDVERLFEGVCVGDVALTAPVASGCTSPVAPSRRLWLRRLARRLARRLPLDLRRPLAEFCRAQIDAARALGRLARALPAAARRRRVAPSPQPVRWGPDGRDDFAEHARAGDVLLTLGAPWFHSDYAGLVRGAATARGLDFVVLIYDLIPVRRPEWCSPSLTRSFEQFFGGTLALADKVLTISHASADEIMAFAASSGMPLAAMPTVLPMGTGFRSRGRLDRVESTRIPASGTYVACVSTIEVRKNHDLLVRVWRRLIETSPAIEVPTLLIVGRVGWLAGDLMRQLESSAFLAGKVVVLDTLSDPELEQVYRGALFTVFPSFYEGWGLPVTESLGFGRGCIASNATSLREAGGSLARYFDPDNTTEAYELILGAIRDRAGLVAWETRIAAEFRPVPWSVTASAVIEAMRAPAATRAAEAA